MLRLRAETPPEWAALACAHLDDFLQDHAANERKVSQSASTLVAQYPTHVELVDALIDVAVEEMQHFQQVWQVLQARGKTLAYDVPDPYMGALMKTMRKGDSRLFLLDRLLAFGIVEARGCERFAMMAEALEPGSMKEFYMELTRSEARHHALYHRLARLYFDETEVETRLNELLDAEAEIVKSLPLRPALH
ncbi:MAG: tRNA-(ms[2]io[6]A)-hydroxylase [Myxococcales bacterium]|nr:tRNA-(ms[2]io[6]A)-hydroxylase [Myxococcales bacterium]